MRERPVLRICLFISLLVCYSTALSQQPQALPDVIGAAVPLYPPIARAANLQGTVVLSVTVEGGRVQSTKLVSGHPLLSRAAESNLGTWELVSMPAKTFAVTYSYKLSERCKGKPTITANFPTEVV
jgi:outer membrane biosynthesis protein TonB